MDKEVTKSTLEVVKDLIKILIKVKLGWYGKNPLGAITDAKDLVDDVKEVHHDIHDDNQDGKPKPQS